MQVLERNYLYTKEQAAELRDRILNGYIKPLVQKSFERYSELQSAMLLVAQYWADEADDAVHDYLLFSVLETPDLHASRHSNERYGKDSINLPDFDDDSCDIKWSAEDILRESIPDFYYWDDNGEAIAAFAAYCRESSHGLFTDYSPYAIFRRQGGDVSISLVGEMIRPWLDGIRPEEWDEE